MTTPNPDESTALLNEHGFSFAEDAPPTLSPPGPEQASGAVELDEEDEDLEFQPRQRTRLHWLTLVLIGLVIWSVGFLVGVLVDRYVATIFG